MSSRSSSVTALISSAPFAEAVRAHWREYLMEAAEVGASLLRKGISRSKNPLPISLPLRAALPRAL